jgi:DNA gyrase/topoisomerase IV subunit A
MPISSNVRILYFFHTIYFSSFLLQLCWNTCPSCSSLRLALENKPQILEDTDRKIMRFEIEKEALTKELERDIKDKNFSLKETKERIKIIEKEIANLKEKSVM